MTDQDLLDLPMQDNDAKAGTIREYLIALLAELWREQDCFSGKRPFGNSDWSWDLYEALGAGGAIHGDPDLDDWDQPQADALVARLIQSLGARP